MSFATVGMKQGQLVPSRAQSAQPALQEPLLASPHAPSYATDSFAPIRPFSNSGLVDMAGECDSLLPVATSRAPAWVTPRVVGGQVGGSVGRKVMDPQAFAREYVRDEMRDAVGRDAAAASLSALNSRGSAAAENSLGKPVQPDELRELKAAVKAFGRDVAGLRADNRALKESSGELEKRLRELNAAQTKTNSSLAVVQKNQDKGMQLVGAKIEKVQGVASEALSKAKGVEQKVPKSALAAGRPER